MKQLSTCTLIALFAACGSEERLGTASKNAVSATAGAASAATNLISITPATNQTLSDDGVITLCFSGKVHPAADQYGDASYYSDPPSAGPLYALSNNPDNFHVDIASQYDDSDNCLQLTLQQTASNATLLANASTLTLTYVKAMMLDENNQPVTADAYGSAGESDFTLTWNLASTPAN